MRYRATNGIVGVLLTEEEAREHYERAQFVVGEFGDTFVTCPRGEYGRLLSIAATIYTPIRGKQGAESEGRGALTDAERRSLDAAWGVLGILEAQTGLMSDGTEITRRLGDVG